MDSRKRQTSTASPAEPGDFPRWFKTFANKETAAVFARLRVRRFDAVLAQALRKLEALNAAADVEFLRVPPGNRLEKLSGDRAGQWSVRINAQWRICFVWREGHAWEVEIVDYH